MTGSKPRVLDPKNLAAQLYHRARGNPPNSGLDSTIGNTCPGLEFDFRAAWRRLLEGITLLEYDNVVVEADSSFKALEGCRLLSIDGKDVTVPVRGPDASLTEEITLRDNETDARVVTMEWSNGFAGVLSAKQGQKVDCEFTAEAEYNPVDPEAYRQKKRTKTWSLTVRPFFQAGTATIDAGTVPAGTLTQGLCSPWQNDYRECVCYYWASSRPDLVNVTTGDDGRVRADNWMQRDRTGHYVIDDYVDSRLITYDELFQDWEGVLHFQVQGHDAPEAVPLPSPSEQKP